MSWLAESEEDPDTRVEEWVGDNGCDAWVITLNGADPLDHAAGWNEHLADDPEDYGAALDRWTARRVRRSACSATMSSTPRTAPTGRST